MGCDITAFAEVRGDDGSWSVVGDVFPLDKIWRDVLGKDMHHEPFGWRSYSLFGWLADVRNYSAVEPIHEPKGVPDDLSPEVQKEYDLADGCCFSYSWLALEELLAPDYDAEINDRRITRKGNGGVTGEPEEGTRMPLRQFLGGGYFDHLDILAGLGKPEDVRVVFWFDN